MKVLDTSVLIDLDNSTEPLSTSINRLLDEPNLFISTVSVFEFWWGVYLTSKRKTKELEYSKFFDDFISAFTIVDVDKTIAIEASTIGVDLRLIGKTIDLHDLYIAATALSLGIPLITGNNKHFESIKNLIVIPWPYKD